MFFYKYIIFIIILYFNTILSAKNRNLSTKTSLDLVTPCSIGLQFSAVVNNTSEEDYFVDVTPEQCCLKTDGNTNSDVIEILGSCSDVVPKGSTKTLKLIAPLIDPYERHGYCIVYLDSRTTDRKRSIMRDKIRIDFDTRLKNKAQYMDIPENIKHCSKIDEDPLNYCNPVNCETYYNGFKSYFNKNTKRCVEVPNCIPGTDFNFPEIIYDPNSNECIDGGPIFKEDIEYIKLLNNNNERTTKDILIIKNFKYIDTFNNTKVGQNFQKPEVIVSQKKKLVQKLKNKCIISQAVMKYLITNKYTLMVLGLVITVQCCLICTMVYCLSKSCTCCQKKKVVRNFFNYRQDASVTTPLIGTSNIDTETTDYQFLSESSNVDKKIKCYKACQKDRRNNAKLSMSDDILSKCLNRRDWNRLPRSDTIPEIKKEYEKESHPLHIENTINEVKVSFESELPKVREDYKTDNKVVIKENKYGRDKESEDYQCELSEKEIRCHTYNCFENKPNISNLVQSKHYGVLKKGRSKKGTISLSTEKGAQAYFSNDSIDDFLSERGMMFLAGDNSKYSFTSASSPAKSSVSSLSSKTSKNNIVKNVLSLLSRKSKPSSVPGTKKSKEHLNLELLHMSRASIYSSTNESDCGVKRLKDSRTSL